MGEGVHGWLQYASEAFSRFAAEPASCRDILRQAGGQVIEAVDQTDEWFEGCAALGDLFRRAREAGAPSARQFTSEWRDACNRLMADLNDRKPSLTQNAYANLAQVVSAAIADPPKALD